MLSFSDHEILIHICRFIRGFKFKRPGAGLSLSKARPKLPSQILSTVPAHPSQPNFTRPSTSVVQNKANRDDENDDVQFLSQTKSIKSNNKFTFAKSTSDKESAMLKAKVSL